MGATADAPPISFGATKTWISSICRASNRLPSSRPPPSTKTLVSRRRPSSISSASNRAAGESPGQTKTWQPASPSRWRLATRRRGSHRRPARALPAPCEQAFDRCQARPACRERREVRCAVRVAGRSAEDRRARPSRGPPRSHPRGRGSRARVAASGRRRSSGFGRCGWRSCRPVSWPTWQ